MPIPSNRLRDIEQYFYAQLADLYADGELRSMWRLLVEGFLDWTTVQYLLHRDEPINQSDLLRFYWAVEDLKRRKPIQYIIGYTQFAGCRIEVNHHVLIPRPETEEIVEQITVACHDLGRVMDLCTGSGCIAIALAKRYEGAEVWGIDVDDQALQVAQRNAEENEVEVRWMQADLLQHTAKLPEGEFDLVVSNPPYITPSEREAMEDNVLLYEPELALFVPNEDPLLFYRVIANRCRSLLSQRGILVFEINELYGKQTLEMLSELNYRAELREDFRGRPRSVWAQYQSGKWGRRSITP